MSESAVSPPLGELEGADGAGDQEARAASPEGLVIASGGVRDGLDVDAGSLPGRERRGQAAGSVTSGNDVRGALVVAHFGIIIDQLRAVCLHGATNWASSWAYP